MKPDKLPKVASAGAKKQTISLSAAFLYATEMQW